MSAVLVHATTIAIGGRGVLILGDSGAGKSDLALRLIVEGALLIADDQTRLTIEGGRLVATAPTTIAGRMEARGVGILSAPQIESATLYLAVELSAKPLERMPEPSFWRPPGVAAAPHLPLISLSPFEPSALAKLRLALIAVTQT